MKKETGSVLMETVLVLPLLIALIFGSLQLAHIHIARQIVSYAAYAAARATLPVTEDKEKEEAEKAACRILCWLAASPDSMHNGVLMPDPDSQPVKKRILSFQVIKNEWRREIELKFAFPLVMPLAAQIIGFKMDPTDFSTGESGSHISTETFQDAFEGPHLILHERISIPKPYIVKSGT